MNADPSRAAALEAIRREIPGGGGSVQRDRCERALRTLGSLSTREARRYLDVSHPAARILELNELDRLQTVTLFKVAESEGGALRRFGVYVVKRHGAD